MSHLLLAAVLSVVMAFTWSASRFTSEPEIHRLVVPGTSSDGPAPTPEPRVLLPERCYSTRPGTETNLAPAALDSVLQNCQVISYYGYPGIPALGVLGEADADTVAAQVKAIAAEFEATNGLRSTVGAYHLIWAVAQANPTDDGTWLVRMPHELVLEYIEAADRNDMIVILDVQMGHSTVDAEFALLLPYLDHPRVHLAMDPEWAMPEGVAPGEVIGGVDAADINRAQQLMSEYIESRGYGNRLLIVHQFVPEMIRNKEQLQQYPGVDLLIDQDGFGTPEQKIANYNRYVREDGAPHGGMKLFYDEDTVLMTPAEVNALLPQPDFIQYQ